MGKYRIESLVARGGMAEVFRASVVEGEGFERPVCLKMVRPELSDDAQFIAMFEREARIAIALRHPNIVQVFDFERHEGRSFLAMELVEGMDLKELLRLVDAMGLRVPTGFALHVTAGLLSALSHAHGHTENGQPRPIVHRDVSPHNILVATSGSVKLADFGIAKARGGSNVTRTGVVKGKLAYLSPEQARCEEVVAGSDLFCAGLVLYEMLTGRRLYSGANEQEVLAMAMQPKVPEIGGASAHVNGFLAGLLAPHPADRFPTAEMALSVLARLREEEPYAEAEAGSLVEFLTVLRASNLVSVGTPSTTSLPLFREPPEGPTMPAVASRKRRGERAPSTAVLRIAGGVLLAVLLVVAVGAGAWSWMRPTDGEAEAPEAMSAQTAGAALVSETPSPAPTARLSSPVSPVVSLPSADGGTGDDPEPSEGSASPAKGPKGFGWLKVNCRPWAAVEVDGKRVGTTPIGKLRLGAGAHDVVLSNETLGYRESMAVRVTSGGTTRINRVASKTGVRTAAP